jgi:hypothetical protein
MTPKRIKTPDQYLPETSQDRVKGGGGLEAAYDDFKNMNLKTANSAEALKFFRYQVARDMLGSENKPFVDAGMSPDAVIKLAKKSSSVDDNKMNYEVKQRFQEWGQMTKQVPSEFRGSGGVKSIQKAR